MDSSTRTARRRGAFTLIELMVVTAIIAVLLSLVAPIAGSVRSSARMVECQITQRSVVFDFHMFADNSLHGDRGDDERDFGRSAFRLETFQESLYGLDEFWRWPGEQVVRLPDSDGHYPLRCAEVKAEMVLQADTPCSNGAVSPPEAVSYGFNIRLHEARGYRENGRPFRRNVTLNTSVLDMPAYTPLLWDVDGAVSKRNGVSPVFSGPNVLLEGDRYWNPGFRHNGKLNVAFMDQHVESSTDPLNESGWFWEASFGH